MFTFLGSLLGFFSAAFPELLKIFREGKDREHEVTILQLQLEQEKLGFQNKLEEIRIGADADIRKEVYKTYTTGIGWVDALNGTVRPVLAYFFFILYAALKIQSNNFWGEEDQIIFSSIISFYFGQRAMQKIKR